MQASYLRSQGGPLNFYPFEQCSSLVYNRPILDRTFWVVYNAPMQVVANNQTTFDKMTHRKGIVLAGRGGKPVASAYAGCQ